MTSRERSLAALRGAIPDRVPVWSWDIHPWLDRVHPTVQPVVDDYLSRGDIIRWWGADTGIFLTASDRVTVKTEQRHSQVDDYDERVTTYTTPAGSLTEIAYVSLVGKPGYQKKHLLDTEDDVAKLLSVPYVPPRPDCSSFFKADRDLGDRGLPIILMPPDPMYFFNSLTGSETFAFWSIEKRALVKEVIGVFLHRVKDWVEWLLAQGVGPLFFYYGPELCIPPLQSPRDFEELVVNVDREINDLIQAAGGIPLVHCHGRMGPVLEGFVRMHAGALHPVEPPPMGDVTLAEAKRRVGGELCIVGNVQHQDICTMPERDFRALIERTVRTGMAGGKFILSPTASPLHWPTMSDLERRNWISMLDVALEVGGY